MESKVFFHPECNYECGHWVFTTSLRCEAKRYLFTIPSQSEKCVYEKCEDFAKLIDFSMEPSVLSGSCTETNGIGPQDCVKAECAEGYENYKAGRCSPKPCTVELALPMRVTQSDKCKFTNDGVISSGSECARDCGDSHIPFGGDLWMYCDLGIITFVDGNNERTTSDNGFTCSPIKCSLILSNETLEQGKRYGTCKSVLSPGKPF